MEINGTQLYFKEIDKSNTPYCLIQYISKLEEKWHFCLVLYLCAT